VAPIGAGQIPALGTRQALAGGGRHNRVARARC
jgi:hypothetical protein